LFVRAQVEAEVRRRIARGEPLTQTVGWLRSTGVNLGEAIEMLEGIGLGRKEAEQVLRAHPDWRPLIDQRGGTN